MDCSGQRLQGPVVARLLAVPRPRLATEVRRCKRVLLEQGGKFAIVAGCPFRHRHGQVHGVVAAPRIGGGWAQVCAERCSCPFLAPAAQSGDGSLNGRVGKWVQVCQPQARCGRAPLAVEQVAVEPVALVGVAIVGQHRVHQKLARQRTAQHGRVDATGVGQRRRHQTRSGGRARGPAATAGGVVRGQAPHGRRCRRRGGRRRRRDRWCMWQARRIQLDVHF